MLSEEVPAKKIPLGRSGLVSLVDAEDFDFLNKFKWCINSRGYVCSSKARKDMRNSLLHRVIMCVQDKLVVVDHKDGNPLNNCKNNLRACNRSMNQHNRKSHHNKVFKGVSIRNVKNTINGKTYSYKYYCTQLWKNNKPLYSKFHKTELEAVKDYNLQAIKHFGEYAKLNNIEGGSNEKSNQKSC